MAKCSANDFSAVDSGSDSDSDTDSDTDTDTDADADTDTDTEGECEGYSDCPGGECVRIPDEPGGWWTCVYLPATPVSEPSEHPESDQCTSSSDCVNAACNCHLVYEFYPGFYYPHNECICDECDDDSDCPFQADQQCIPAGAWGFNEDTCLYVSCKLSQECTEANGGVCMPYFDGICSTLDQGPVLGKACHYDDDPCISPEDCPLEGQNCAPTQTSVGFECVDWACPG